MGGHPRAFGTFARKIRHYALEEGVITLGEALRRSPMAEFILKDMVCAGRLQDQFRIESAAVSDEEYGNPIYPPSTSRSTR